MRMLVSAVLVLMTSSAFAEKGILVVHVKDLRGKPIGGVRLRAGADTSVSAPTQGRPKTKTTSATGGATDTFGQARIVLSPGTSEGDAVVLEIVDSKRDLVFISPWDRIAAVPKFDGKPTSFVSVVLTDRNDRLMLENPDAMKSLLRQWARELTTTSAEDVAVATPKGGEKAVDALDEVARRVGLPASDIDKAIRALRDKTVDPYERGLIAFYERRYADAVPDLAKALRSAEEEEEAARNRVADTASLLGVSLYMELRFSAAAAVLEKATERRVSAYDVRYHVAALLRDDRPDEADALLDKVLPQLRLLAERDVAKYGWDLIFVLQERANFDAYVEMGDQDQNCEVAAEQYAVARRLAHEYPDQYEPLVELMFEYKWQMARVDTEYEGEAAAEQGDRITRRFYEQIIATYTPLAKHDPAYELWVAGPSYKLAQFAQRAGAWQEVYDHAQRVRSLFSRATKRRSPYQRLIPKIGHVEEIDPELGVSHALFLLSSAEVQLKRPADAERHLQQSMVIVRKLAERDPEQFTGSLADALVGIGFQYQQQERWVESAAAYKEALAIYGRLQRESPEVGSDWIVILNRDLFEISQKLGEPPAVVCAYLAEAWKASEGSSSQRGVEHDAFQAYRDGVCTAELLAPMPDPEDAQYLAPSVDRELRRYDAAVAAKSYEACGALIDAWQFVDDLPRRRAIVQRKADEAVKAGLCVEGFLTDPEETSMNVRLIDYYLADFDRVAALKLSSACESLVDAWKKSENLPRRRAAIQQRAQQARQSGLCTAEQIASIPAQQ